MGWLRGWLVLWLNNVIKDSRAFYVLCHSQPASLSPASSFHVPTKTGIFQARSEHIKGPSVPKKSCLGTDLPQVSVDRIITPAHARSLICGPGQGMGPPPPPQWASMEETHQ